MPASDEQYDEIDLMELLMKCLKEWRLILKWCAVAAIIGLVAGFSIPKTYTVTATLAPESQSGSVSGAASLARSFGFNIGGANSGSDALVPSLYPDIVNSNPFVVELFREPVTFTHKKEQLTADYYTYLAEYQKTAWWSKVISAPSKALGWCIGLVTGREEEEDNGISDIDPYALTFRQGEMAASLRRNMSVSVDTKTYVVSVSVTAQDPNVATHITEVVIDGLKRHITEYRTEKSRHDMEYYQQMCDETQAEYLEAQQRYARYVDSNHAVALESYRIEESRLKNEASLKFELYNQMAQQLQLSRAQVQQDTPVLAVIDPPSVPFKKSKPSKAKILVLFVFLAACCAIVWVLWVRDWLRELRKGAGEEDTASADTAAVRE